MNENCEPRTYNMGNEELPTTCITPLSSPAYQEFLDEFLQDVVNQLDKLRELYFLSARSENTEQARMAFETLEEIIWKWKKSPRIQEYWLLVLMEGYNEIWDSTEKIIETILQLHDILWEERWKTSEIREIFYRFLEGWKWEPNTLLQEFRKSCLNTDYENWMKHQ